MWLLFVGKEYSFNWLITNMDAVLILLFPITGLLLIKDMRLGFLATPLSFTFAIIYSFKYLFLIQETAGSFIVLSIGIYCVIAVFVSALFFINIKIEDPGNIPRIADPNGEAKNGS